MMINHSSLKDFFDLREHTLRVALVISLALHILLVSILSIFDLNLIKIRKIPQMSVTYYAVKKKPMRVVQITSDEIKIVKPSKSPQDVDVLSKKLNTIVSLGNNFRDISKSKEVIPAGRKQSPKIVSLNDVEKRITVPVLKSEKITNPKYLSFSEGIRQKIRQRAFGFVNHPDFKAGEVYLTFVLDSSGKLQDVKIIDEKTHANDFLRDVGLKSVRESGPFAPFPKDLNYAELTFNVIISFEMGE